VLGLRLIYLAALAAWLGGLLVLGGIAAPAIFAVAQANDPASGRVLAGTMFGAVLARFHVVAALCGMLMAVTLVAMALVGPRPRPYAARLVVIALMLLATAVVAFPVGRGIARLQRESGQAINTLPADDARRVAFARLHGLSNVLLLANVAGGLLLLAWEAQR
jgi:Domain of unknown function (DUF4149)